MGTGERRASLAVAHIIFTIWITEKGLSSPVHHGLHHFLFPCIKTGPLSSFTLPVPAPQNSCVYDLWFKQSPNRGPLGGFRLFNIKHCFNEPPLHNTYVLRVNPCKNTWVKLWVKFKTVMPMVKSPCRFGVWIVSLCYLSDYPWNSYFPIDFEEFFIYQVRLWTFKDIFPVFKNFI